METVLLDRIPLVDDMVRIDWDVASDWRHEVEGAIASLFRSAIAEGYSPDARYNSHSEGYHSARFYLKNSDNEALAFELRALTMHDGWEVDAILEFSGSDYRTQHGTSVSVRIRTTDDPIDIYDRIADRLAPGIERMKFPVQGICEYM